jgi:maltooligosyltrehalose trehalohydrolase
VREWAIQNAEHWVRDYHIDGLRLDAVHAIFDDTPHHVCAELAERVHALKPRTLVISEVEVDNWTPIDEWGHDAQWADRAGSRSAPARRLRAEPRSGREPRARRPVGA